MTVKLISFGFKFGAPSSVTRTVDCRKLENPHNNAKLRPLTGRHVTVQAFVSRDEKFRKTLQDALKDVKDGDSIAFGCVGGRHRSVAMVELASHEMCLQQFDLELIHRELTEGDK